MQDVQQSDDPFYMVVTRLWHARLFILVGMLVGFLCAFFLSYVLKPHYDVWMIIAPPRQGAETVNFLAEDLPPVLAPIAQKSTSRDGEYVRFQQSLRGAAVASVLLKMDGMVDGLNQKTLMRWGEGDLLDSREIADHLSKNIRFDPVGATESYRVLYRHPDPEIGTRLLRNLIKISDQLIRLDVRKDVDARIDWLKRAMKVTLNPDHRQALTRLLMAEERRQMLLSIETPYAVSVIEEATFSPKPVVPNKFLLFPLLILFSGLAGYAVFSVRQKYFQCHDR